MATTMPHVENVDDEPIVCLRAGASIVETKPVFSHDAKYLFCGCGSRVKVYSTESGECVRQLDAHKQDVTGLSLNPANRLQLLTCGRDAQVIFWDYADGVMLKAVTLPHPLYGFVNVTASGGQFQLCLLQKTQKKANAQAGQLVRYTFTVKDSTISKPSCVFDHCNLDTKTVAVGFKESYYAAIAPNHRELVIWHNKKLLRYKVQHTQLKCIAAHPTETSIATGCADGKIYYWYNFTNERQMVKSVYHWHALPVINLTFSPEGSYLLSGGHESTLVKWQYETHYKDFLPRLGSPISHITVSPDNLVYAVSHEDNGIHLLSNTLQIRQIYQGLTRTGARQGNPVGLLCDPRSSCLLSNGRPGHLQFFSLHADKQLYNLDIVQQNYVSSGSLKSPLTMTRITLAGVDERGDWLVTYQLWDDGEMSPEMQLKFWRYDSESQRYVMNTVVDRPHDEALCSLKLRPYTSSQTPPLTVTSAADHRFKLWTLVDDTDIYRANNKWSCDSVGFYRDMSAGQTAFAEDGSLLAVVFQSAITLWDPDTNVLRTTLTNSFATDNVRHVLFGRDSCCHLLVSATNAQLNVWNLLSCTVEWSVSTAASVIVDDPLSKYMAVFSHTGHLHVFEPSNPVPVFTQKQKNDVVSAVFIPHKEESSESSQGRLFWQRHSQLYYMTSNQELFTVQYHTPGHNGDKKKSIRQKLPQSALSLIVTGQKSGFKSPKHDQLDMSLGSRETQYVKQMLNQTFVAQPPIPSLCQTFMETRLSKLTDLKSSSALEVDEEDIEDIDRGIQLNIDVDSDSDMEIDQRSRSWAQNPKQEVVKTESVGGEENSQVLPQALKCDLSWFEKIAKS